MDYPKGTKFGDWSVYLEPQREKQVYVVRRRVTIPGQKARNERLKKSKYRQWASDPSELKKLCVRLNRQLNCEEKLRIAVEIKHSYISPVFLDEYREYLLTQSPSPRKARSEFQYLVHYFLNFFITELKIPDPLEWHIHHKTKWAEYLIGEKTPSSTSSKKEVVRAANRFMAYLHEQRPAEVPPLKFTPLTRAKYKKIEAERVLAGKIKTRSFIKDEHWAIIRTKLKELASSIEPFALLAYHYGLRRSETMGLDLSDIRNGYLFIQKQLVRFNDDGPKYGPLKGRKTRKVPHSWFSTPTLANTWINESKDKLMHPDTLTDRWTALMDKLKLPYDFHDLRHTWCSRAVRLKDKDVSHIRDVMLAAGHENIETTMGYLHDDRNLDDELFTTEAS